MDYGDILVYIEQMIESIEYDEINLLEIKQKLEDLAADIEDNVETSEDFEGFNFSDLD
jgi:hypothetical protein